MRAPRRMVTEGTIPVTRKDYQPDREGPNAISLFAGKAGCRTADIVHRVHRWSRLHGYGIRVGFRI
jgi:hypothetical protein